MDNRPATAAGCQVQDEPECYIPDLLSDRDYEPDPALIKAAQRVRKLIGCLITAIAIRANVPVLHADALDALQPVQVDPL